MVYKNGLDKLADLFGGKFYEKKKKPLRRNCWVWMTFNSNAAEALQALLPFLVVKKEQAEVGLKCNWDSFRGGQPLLEQQDFRQEAHDLMKILNKRGVDV